jgi:prepilin-type N-terminal cleavage/methylation domain-containing protein
MSYFIKKQKGFTMIEVLIVIVLCTIIIMAALGLYFASDKIFKQTRPISDVLEEMRSAIATLDFVFSRWGAGVPCYNNNCNEAISECVGPQPDNYPPYNRLCMSCNSGNLISGCSDIEFYANLEGYGFVVSVNGTQTNLISCRLRNTDLSNDTYYIWEGDKVVNYNGTDLPKYKLNLNSDDDNKDCINFAGGPNVQHNVIVQEFNGTGNYTLQPGDMITRVPHKVRLYVNYDSDDKGYWLYIKKFDIGRGTTYTTKLGRVKDLDSFKVYSEGRAIKVEVEFQSQSKPEKTLKIIKYFAR